jgi:hypothetical protein
MRRFRVENNVIEYLGAGNGGRPLGHASGLSAVAFDQFGDTGAAQ